MEYSQLSQSTSDEIRVSPGSSSIQDPMLEADPYEVDPYYATVFPRARTIPVSVLRIILLMLNQIQAMFDWYPLRIRCVLFQTCLLLTLSASYLLLRAEHARIRQRGYVRFYVEASGCARLSLLLAAHATCLVCVVYAFVDVLTYDGAENTLLGLMSFEHLLLLACEIVYTRICWRHNLARAHPDAEASAVSMRTPVGEPPQQPPGTLVGKQVVMVQQLESEITALNEKLAKARTKDTKGAEEQKQNPQVEELEASLAAKEGQVRDMTLEIDTLRRELQMSCDEFEQFQHTSEMLQQQNKQQLDTITQNKRKLRQLTKDNKNLSLLVEVHKETNANAQKVIESLSGTPAGQFSINSVGSDILGD